MAQWATSLPSMEMFASLLKPNSNRPSMHPDRTTMARRLMASRRPDMQTRFLIFIGLIVGTLGSVAQQNPQLVSGAPLTSSTAAGTSSAAQVSSNGRYVFFLSHAKNLTTNDVSGLSL